MNFQPIGPHPKPKPIQMMGWRRIENLVKICEKMEENMINMVNPNILHISQKPDPKIRLEMSNMEV
ncbi:MAG: hypothetical protein KAS47_04045 [Candidatus Heimdallarchaeota archaeon]|nr:hypothetical protein [Candidatus Heimdallarchaeota archaeon]